jgi:serine/threonine-protein kinase
VPPREAAVLVAALADGVEHAHRHGVIHRDLKPSNVLLTADGAPKITDFGLAKVLSESQPVAPEQTQSGAIIGTPAYMAPEQAAAQRDQVGPASDIWSLGIILYELLTGRPPFQADTTLETLLLVRWHPVAPPLRPAVPRDLEWVCLALQEPGRRWRRAQP